MTAPLIKICGLKSAHALDAAVKARADYAGFVFFARSPRNVSLPDAQKLGERAEGHIRRVGLFVDADDALLAEATAAAQLDALQLHGQETPERAAHLKARFGLPVWKAVSVSSAQDIAKAGAFAQAADLILFDAKTPKGAGLPGGMGLSFDWNLLANARVALPWGLAGGLTPDNVGHAVRLTGAGLVDTSSGVESAPGVKDVDRIAAFCHSARNS